MIISKLGLRQFRNIKEQVIHLSPGLNVFYGLNGQGKTNLIEAVYLLTHGKSFRTSDVSFLINKNDFSGFSLESEFFKRKTHYDIKIIVSGKTKSIRVDEKKMAITGLRKMFSSILFSPETLQIIKDSDKKRRELIDSLCFFLFPDFHHLYDDCQKLLKQKNSLLKKIKEKRISLYEGERLNRILTLQLLDKNSQLCVFRLEAIEKIEALLPEKFLKITEDSKKRVSIEYIISNQGFKNRKKDEFFNAMYKDWKKKRGLEVKLGQCLVGAHRHGVNFEFDGRNARFFCSQGQQRAIILSFKIAQMELYCEVHKEFPVLLLDDVFSELDGKKQMNFLEELLSTGSQIFLTTAEKTLLEEKTLTSVFKVEEGVFHREKGKILSGKRGLNV